jgi:hypothetical protein
MASGRIRRSARRGITAAVLGWLGVAAFSVLMAPAASAAPTATVEIKTVTPPAVSVDKGGTVTFVNAVDSYNTGVNLGIVGSFTATVNTDVAVTFFDEKRTLAPGKNTAWTFNDPVTPGTITYTYRIVPQSGLSATVANQVVSAVAGSLPALPAPVPYAVNTLIPLPNLPSTNLPQLPTVTVPLPDPTSVVPNPPGVVPNDPTQGLPTPPAAGPAGPAPQGIDGTQYNYDVSGSAPNLSPRDGAAATAFDGSRFSASGASFGAPTPRGSNGSETGGAGGQPGGYDGASVPVFGQLAGLDGSSLEEDAAADAVTGTAPALPAAALAAVVALAAVTAALIRTHQARRSR